MQKGTIAFNGAAVHSDLESGSDPRIRIVAEDLQKLKTCDVCLLESQVSLELSVVCFRCFSLSSGDRFSNSK
ncbi:hypothetical protein TNCT_405661 [Trichonephila clavata]|uniref:Uncharacterized protein n=1 Tax=Trichonephila clavata TaxID=2740835 RepID=A0A8X6LHI9_TRICU|nr:hypothetical protein TNCT_405661 [Trichonephila clavata]